MITTRNVRTEVLSLVAAGGWGGLTVAEARDLTGAHHGHVSGALSMLHRDGHIARLAVRRNGCKVYVLPTKIHGRPTEAQGRA